MSRWRIDARKLHGATLTPPLSKSDAQRAQVLAWIDGSSLVLGEEAALPADVRVMRAGLNALTKVRHTPGEVEIDCADGGAPFRLLLSLAASAVAPGSRVTFHGTPRLAARPHAALFHALQEAFGEDVLRPSEGSLWPLVVTAQESATARRFRLDATESSQYATGLLLAAAARVHAEAAPWELELCGDVASRGYLELTLAWLARAGFTLDLGERRIAVSAHAPGQPLPEIPGDWSSLGYLLLASWATGSPLQRVDVDAAHPDRAMLRILNEVGLELKEGVVRGTALEGLRASGRECPDLLPTLAALACVLPLPSVLEDTDILIGKESDRQAAIIALVDSVGGSARLRGTTLEIHPPSQPIASFQIDSRSDHRIAMASTTLALLTRATLQLEHPECVEKSFPTFWSEVRKLGVKTAEID